MALKVKASPIPSSTIGAPLVILCCSFSDFVAPSFGRRWYIVARAERVTGEIELILVRYSICLCHIPVPRHTQILPLQTEVN